MRVPTWLGLVVCCALAPVSGRADVTLTDLQIAARALSFMEDPLTGTVRVGIVHAPTNARSARQAEDLRSMLAGGLQVGSLELRPVMVRLDEAQVADVDLFFLTEYLNPHEVPLSAVSAARRIPCVTTDIAQVQSGACIMGVRSAPKIEILVNRAASIASGMAFATVFRVMITEL
jgi:ABC-type uncharacterized transport system substrate-binding protein